MFRRLRTGARWLSYRAFPGALILRYHRVADLQSDPHATAVTPAHFAEQLETLRARFRPLSLRSLVRSLGHEGPPRSGVVITFDDGYADNLYQAKPLLERYEIPATVFVATGAVDAGREFWWDELESILLRPGTLPRTLTLGTDDRPFEGELGESATYTEADYERDRGWSWRVERDPTARQRLFRRVFQYLRELGVSERSTALAELREWAGGATSERRSHRILTADELGALAAGGLVEVGAHTITHPPLSRLSADERRKEIAGSKAFLEEVLGRPVTSFAYPYGDVGGSRRQVSEAGFHSACTTRAGIATRYRDRLRLPRIYAGDWSGEEFERRISELP